MGFIPASSTPTVSASDGSIILPGPAQLAGNAGKVLTVKPDASGYELDAPAAGGGGGVTLQGGKARATSFLASLITTGSAAPPNDYTLLEPNGWNFGSNYGAPGGELRFVTNPASVGGASPASGFDLSAADMAVPGWFTMSIRFQIGFKGGTIPQQVYLTTQTYWGDNYTVSAPVLPAFSGAGAYLPYADVMLTTQPFWHPTFDPTSDGYSFGVSCRYPKTDSTATSPSDTGTPFCFFDVRRVG